MRANVLDYALAAPATLAEALQTLARNTHTPLAGGTELMVALAAGRLPQKPLLSLHKLHELRFVETTPEHITLGAASTFTDIRNHPAVAADLPMLAQAASWTGSLANQNRGTLGGNLVNASPAADSPPALLVYEATLTLISAGDAGIVTRTLPYTSFHLRYKQTALRPGELLHSISIPRTFPGYKHYIRKVGARNAQAISKVALACLARITLQGFVDDIRIAAASLRETPARCPAAEAALRHQPLTPTTIAAARAALLGEALPIDDIRSTAKYRAAVAANLLEEFLLESSRDEQKLVAE